MAQVGISSLNEPVWGGSVVQKEDEEAEAEKPKVCEGQTLEERRRLRQKLNEHKHRIANDKQVRRPAS